MGFKSKYTREQIEAILDAVGQGGGGETPSEPSAPSNGWTGHADVEGLKAIGWDDEDISCYQKYGVDWDEEDDELHKVSDDNKALYGVLTVDNIQTYKDRIVYLPKIDTSSKTDMNNLFKDCYAMVAMPILDTSRVTTMLSTFSKCHSLVYTPPLNTSKVTSMMYVCDYCCALKYFLLDTTAVKNLAYAFRYNYSLTYINNLSSGLVTNFEGIFSYCYPLTSVQLDMATSTNVNNSFNLCYSLIHAYIKNVKLALNLSVAANLSKESLLYIINNEAATSAITITLAPYAKTRLANDADVVAALANHPNVSLA